MKRLRGPLNRANSLRASCLGANDGILSTAGLLVGVAATSMTRDHVILAGLAGAAAGALSMAVGEYISVSAQNNIEQAERMKSKGLLLQLPDRNVVSLENWLQKYGVSNDLARKTIEEIKKKNPEILQDLNIPPSNLPIQAATSSAVSFGVGALAPLLAATFAASDFIWHTVAASSLFALAILGALAALFGGGPVVPAIVRVVGMGAFAMVVTWALGRVIDGSVF